MKRKQYLSSLALAISLSLGLSSCSDDSNQAETAAVQQVQTTSGSAILSYIPADTPLLMVFTQSENHPMPENFKEKMNNIYSKLGEFVRKAIESELANKSEEEAQKAKDVIDTWLSDESLEKFGLSFDENEWAVYAIDLAPVVRVTLAETHQMGEMLDEALAKINEKKADTATKKDVDGASVYMIGDKELQVMVSLKGNEFAVSLAPSHQAEELMPKLMGFEKPANNISNSDQYKNTLKKYNFIDTSLTWVDFKQIADYFLNPGKYNSPILDMMQIQDNKFSEVCKTEILAMFDKAPRLVGGSTLLEEHEMSSHLIWEMDSELGSKLSTITGRIPKATDTAKMAYGFSFDIVAAKQVAQDFANNIQQNPFQCELFANMNNQVAMIQQQLNQPLPPFVSNFKGVNIVLDELDLDLSQTDPDKIVKSVKGNVLLAVDNPEALKGMAEMVMPELQQLGLTSGGDAVNISNLIPVKGTMMPINLDHVFLAMGDETIGLSLGENTNAGLKTSVSNDANKALLSFKIDAELYKSFFSGIASMADKLPGNQKAQMELQQSMMTDMLWWKTEEATVNFTSNGLEIIANIEY